MGTCAWWTVEEFADVTRRSPAAVRAAIARGTLPAVRIGRRWFIDPVYFQRKFEQAARAIDHDTRRGERPIDDSSPQKGSA